MQAHTLSDVWIRSQDPVASITSTLVDATRHLLAESAATGPTEFEPWVWEPVVGDAPGVDLYAIGYAPACTVMSRLAHATYRSFGGTEPRRLLRPSPMSDQIGRPALERGVAHHVIGHAISPDVLADPTNTPRDTFVVSPSAALKVNVADGRIGVVSSGGGRKGLLVSTQRRFVAACIRYIEAATSLGRPVQPRWRNPAITPTVRQLRILRLLAIGDTDASAGTKLGVSDRLVRREIAELYSIFGVRSRFELGMAYSTWMAGG